MVCSEVDLRRVGIVSAFPLQHRARQYVSLPLLAFVQDFFFIKKIIDWILFITAGRDLYLVSLSAASPPFCCFVIILYPQQNALPSTATATY